MQLSRAAVSIVLLAARVPALGQGIGRDQSGSAKLINLETPSVAKTGSISWQGDVRAFNRPESIFYSSLTVRYGL